MLSAVPAKRNYSTRIDLRLTINNATKYQRRKGNYLMGLLLQQAEIDLSHHDLTSVGVPYRPSMS
jgi:hypothetical protein